MGQREDKPDFSNTLLAKNAVAFSSIPLGMHRSVENAAPLIQHPVRDASSGNTFEKRTSCVRAVRGTWCAWICWAVLLGSDMPHYMVSRLAHPVQSTQIKQPSSINPAQSPDPLKNPRATTDRESRAGLSHRTHSMLTPTALSQACPSG